MVNKAVVAVLGVVLVTSLGVGALVGMQLGGGGDAGIAGGGDGDGTEDGQANETAVETATPTETATPEYTAIPPRRFEASAIEDEVADFVNDEREARSLDRAKTNDKTANELEELARNQSERMAVADETVHEIDGLSTRDRYKLFGLYERCSMTTDRGNIGQPNEDFEALGRTHAGQPYERGGETLFHDDERGVARDVVDRWMNSSEYSDRLLTRDVGRLGVGAVVTQDGVVYVTAVVCS